MLVIAITRPSALRRRPEAQWRRYAAQGLRGKRPAKRKQHASLIDIGLPRRIPCERADGRLHHHTCHRVERSSNRSHAAAKPPDSARQRNLRSAHRVGSSLHAPGRRYRGDAVFDRGEQARQPGSKKIRKQAERAMAFGAIPSRDPHPARRHTPIAPMTGKRATTRRVQGAFDQTGITPFTVLDIRLDARRCPQRDLQCHSPTRRRSATRRRELCRVRRPDVAGQECRISPPLRIKSGSR